MDGEHGLDLEVVVKHAFDGPHLALVLPQLACVPAALILGKLALNAILERDEMLVEFLFKWLFQWETFLKLVP
jgi:hypothetical protein